MRADGSEFPVELTVTRVPLDGPPNFTAYLRDITERKHAESELRASRARVIESADRERRRIERNLHDGAQQRLVAIGLTLRRLAMEDDTPASLHELIELAQAEAGLAIAELRELARGIHPAVLTESGLATALRALALRSPLETSVEATELRLPESVEIALYYVAAEALANVAKYAQATNGRDRAQRGRRPGDAARRRRRDRRRRPRPRERPRGAERPARGDRRQPLCLEQSRARARRSSRSHPSPDAVGFPTPDRRLRPFQPPLPRVNVCRTGNRRQGAADVRCGRQHRVPQQLDRVCWRDGRTVMTIAGADFLVKIATIAVAFVGWSAIAVTFRRALGFELDALHMYFVRFFIEGGLAVAAFGLIPPALALTRLEDATIWRLSSAGAALTFSGWFACLLRRRRRVTRGPIPMRTVVHFATGITAALVLWANTYGLPAPSPGAYALALVALLVVGGCVFAQNLEFFFNQATEDSRCPGRGGAYRGHSRTGPSRRALHRHPGRIDREHDRRTRVHGHRRSAVTAADECRERWIGLRRSAWMRLAGWRLTAGAT